MALALVMNTFVADAAFSGFDQVTPVQKQREWGTDVATYATWCEQRNQWAPRPRRHWFINWELLDKAGRDKLIELFDAAKARYDTFLWLDDDEYLASAVVIATNGTAASYQLKQNYRNGESYQWTENKKDIVPGTIYAPVVVHSVDGPQTEVAAAPGANQYTLNDSTGIMVWSAGNEPSAGYLTCTFEYYFRVRWTKDAHSDVLWQPRLYRGEDLHIVEVVPW